MLLTRRPVRAGLVVAALAAALVAPAASTQAARTPQVVAEPSTGPHHVVFIVLDQLRPEFITAFDMQHVQALMAGGTTFPNAYLGHMASETVVSHNVMTSGVLPKHMGWSDEWYRDAGGVLDPVTPNKMYVTGSMSASQFDTLINSRGYWKLPSYLHEKFPGTVVAAIGQKNYATYTMGGPDADMRITMSSRNYDCDVDSATTNNWRGPTGTNVPSYITGTYVANSECSRFYVDSNKAHSYGTATTSPAWMYPLEGNRDVPGTDPDHLGGDVWSTDAALAVMQHENWSGILLTLGGIDKAGHMWGGLNDTPPYPAGAEDFTHMAAQAKTADDQVGRVMDELENLGIADDTLVVLTTDHAQQTGETFYGIDGPARGNYNWYYGTDDDENYTQPQPEIQELIDGTGGNVRASMQDSAIRTWLTNTSLAKKRQAADVMATLGGVRASYYRMGNHYVLRHRAPDGDWSASERAWFDQHAQEIVDTEAAAYGPDVIGLLAEDTSYGVKGDHGGAQEPVQRIPIVFWGAGVQAGRTPAAAIRSVDITPTILRELGIAPHQKVDGRAYRLP